jgi:hypothetical protein
MLAAATATAIACIAAQGATAAQGSTAVAHGKKAVHPAICATSYNPYAEAESVLRSCGDVMYPLLKVTRMPGGGKSYDYGVVTQVVPPTGFNALRASSKQLQEYGLPTRKQLGSDWYAYLSHDKHFVGPTPYLVGIPALRRAITSPVRSDTSCTPPACSNNWSGYEAYTGHSYDFASAVWDEPAFTSDSCNPTAFVQWTGVGGGTTGSEYLGQDGTAFGVPGLSDHQAWIETMSGSPSPLFGVNLTATKNDPFSSIAQWVASDSKFEYNMANETTGQIYDGWSRAVDVDQITAEIIAERPVINGSYSDLSDYQAFAVDDATFGWDTGTSGLSNMPSGDYTGVVMRDSNLNLMSEPSSVSNNNFEMIYENNCS